MRHLKNIFFFSSSFSEKASRMEYAIYLFISTLIGYFALHLYSKIELDNEKILYFFYIDIIVLMLIVPNLAVSTRRLRDLNTNPTFIIFNFIPILNIIFKIFLLVAKPKKET